MAVRPDSVPKSVFGAGRPVRMRAHLVHSRAAWVSPGTGRCQAMWVDTQRDGRHAVAEAGVSGPLDPDRVVFLIEDDEDVPPAPDVAAEAVSVVRRRVADLVASHLVDPQPPGFRNEAETVAFG